MFLWYFELDFNNQIMLIKVINFTSTKKTRFSLDFVDNGKELVIDIDSKKKEEILSHCLQTIGKSR